MTSQRVCTLDELVANKAFRVVLDGHAIVVVKDGAEGARCRS